ncbi:MAG TPA: ABC-F family ATP-binding cassette domain-containing protein [Chloroflexota bacterium]|nr:ABC-F family ATP-binding cassette domain-containing protein [Chloroflexota bacterium]
MLLAVDRVSKRFGPQVVLNDVSFVVNETDRIALVGPNGAGKSTLLKIMAGRVAADAGQIVVPRPIDIGYLPQAVEAQAGESVDGIVRAAQRRLQELGERLRTLEVALAGGGPGGETLLLEHADVADEYQRLGGYDLDHRIEEVFDGLGIEHLPREREVATLSGGEKARVALAALLLRAADLLLLDEPTNHLDLPTLDWLERFLGARRGAFVVVSHDRQLINRMATSVVEIDEYLRDARVFSGNYDAYAAAKAKELAQWREAYEREQEEIRSLRAVVTGSARRVGHTNRPPPDNDKYAKTFFGENVQRAVSRNVRAAQEKLRRIEAEPLLRPPDPLRLDAGFDGAGYAGQVALAADGVRKSYGGGQVLAGVDLALRRDSRLVLTGHNGAGKTVLLRILAGVEVPDDGTVTRAPGVRLGYLDQEQEELDVSQRVFDAYRAGQRGVEDSLRASLFRHGFFRHDDVQKRVGELSLGQRRKLQLARLIASRPNVLLLDEPTNHLDLPTLEAFEAALAAFTGPVLAVSHDRWFMRRFGGDVLELRDGRVV